MSLRNHRDLLVWQKGMGLVVEVYKLEDKLPQKEIFAMSSQLRRAAVSVPCNIAEGYNRKSSRDYAHFLYIAWGSNEEVDTLIRACELIGYLTHEETETSLQLCAEISKMLRAMIDRITPDGGKNMRGQEAS